jgi:hypothetical protein
VQVVAFDVADDVAVDIYLVQVAGAVIQAIDGAPIRQGGGDAVAQWVVLVAEGTLCGGFAQQVTQQIVAEGDEVGFCFCGQAGFFVANFDKVVGFVVLVSGGAVGGVFADQAADDIAFEAVDDFGTAAGSKVHGADVIQCIVAVFLFAPVQIGLFDEAVGGIVLELIVFAVFVDEGVKAAIGVVYLLLGAYLNYAKP